tara:strand:+ start:7674 stop:8507 length:834 start_codon:yes stop_codon:yes gene_type:complete
MNRLKNHKIKLMTETIDSIKKEAKERLSNPFYGKFILAWLICNWKIPYVTFFVDENKLKSNRLEIVSSLLKCENFNDFLRVYLLPIIITIILIWGLPYITDFAFKASEKFRKKKALTKKKTDEDISNSKDEQIANLEKSIEKNQRWIDEERFQKNELRLFLKYLSEDRKDFYDEHYEKIPDEFKKSYLKLIKKERVIDKINFTLDKYNKSNYGNSFFEDLDDSDKNFLIDNYILRKVKNKYELNDFGKAISKHRLIEKYGGSIEMIDLDYTFELEEK